jgi:mono/diheme cytochrome c family protein
MKTVIALLLGSACFSLSAQSAWADIDAEKLFKKKCSACHKMEGISMGPTVLKMNTDPVVLKSAIADGRKFMPTFAETLGNEKINALVVYIQSKQAALNPCANKPGGK